MLSTRYAPTGMVASVDHLASGAGVELLRRGAGAADAAIGASAVLAVTAPFMCGMGGDLFAMVHAGGDGVAALNASGRAGSGADPDRLRAEGATSMPFSGDLRSATVPGCVDGWITLHERFGRLPLSDVLSPAIGYATDGFPASVLLAWSVGTLEGVDGCEDLLAAKAGAGTVVRRPGVARALRDITEHGRNGFYGGEFGRGLVAMGGGEYTVDDLARPLADWVTPLRARVWGHDIWTEPPNSQGYLTLLGCAVAEGLALPDQPDDGRFAHLLVESARAAAFDRPQVLHEHAAVDALLDPGEVGRRRSLVDPGRRAMLATPVGSGDTMFLCAVDADRMGVSLIQSNASAFGCNVFEPATGIGLHNRGIGFNLVPGHPAEYGPGRRPPHTLAPAIVTRPDGSLAAVIGTMGGDAQPQVLLQLLCRWLRYGGSPGSVIDAPRFALTGSAASGFDTWNDPEGVRVEVEATAPADWAEQLRRRGHKVKVVDGLSATFGHAQMIEVREGVLAGAADPRSLNGAAAGY